MSNQKEEQKLTNEGIAKVFAMYIGSEFLYEHGEPEEVCGVLHDIVYDQNADESGEGIYYIRECKLMLTPLSEITDEHATEIAIILGSAEHLSIESKIGQVKELLCTNDFYNKQTNIPGYKWTCVFQYLISKNYAVPLFFGISNYANGKTAIELGIAIEKPNI